MTNRERAIAAFTAPYNPRPFTDSQENVVRQLALSSYMWRTSKPKMSFFRKLQKACGFAKKPIYTTKLKQTKDIVITQQTHPNIDRTLTTVIHIKPVTTIVKIQNLYKRFKESIHQQLRRYKAIKAMKQG